jgi:hypothetical protein
MGMLPRIDKLERAPKRLAKAHRIVPHHWKAAASFWPVKGEGRNDRVPSNFQGSLKTRDIRSTVMVLREEMEGGPIMPDAICLERGLPHCSVSNNPMNPCRTTSKANLSSLKCCFG